MKRDKILRLELEFYMTMYYDHVKTGEIEFWKDEFHCVSDKKDIEPIFNKNGWYYNRTTGQCWIECDGKAKEWEPKEFKSELNNIQYGEKYNEKLLKSLYDLLFICKYRDQKLLNLYWGLVHWADSRRVYRESRKFVIQYSKE